MMLGINLLLRPVIPNPALKGRRTPTRGDMCYPGTYHHEHANKNPLAL